MHTWKNFELLYLKCIDYFTTNDVYWNHIYCTVTTYIHIHTDRQRGQYMTYIHHTVNIHEAPDSASRLRGSRLTKSKKWEKNNQIELARNSAKDAPVPQLIQVQVCAKCYLQYATFWQVSYSSRSINQMPLSWPFLRKNQNRKNAWPNHQEQKKNKNKEQRTNNNIHYWLLCCVVVACRCVSIKSCDRHSCLAVMQISVTINN